MSFMHSAATRLAALCLAILFGLQSAQAEPRIALVVGNGTYATVTQLDNPVPDAQLMAQTLKEKGFTVKMLTDATQLELNRGIAQFGRDLRKAGPDATGLFFYAGHAVQSFGSNFFLPVDTSLTDAADLSLVAVQADAVLRQMFSAKNKTNIVIFDACRNNPFETIPDLGDNGLAEMKAPTGTFLSYSTAPGAVALDGLDGNSPFTKALAQEIPVAGVPIEQLFKNVRVDVIAQTRGAQTPWDTSSLTADFFFEAAAQLTAEELAEQQMWDSVRNSTDPVPVLLFIRAYPASMHIPEARKVLSTILASELSGDDAPKTATAVPTKTIDQTSVVAPTPSTQAPVPIETEQDTLNAERALIGVAQASGQAADYEAYLKAFPNGVYAELAGFELDVIAQKAALANADVTPVAVAETPVQKHITFKDPLTVGGEVLVGKTIEELVNLTPLFPPIDGLPEEFWKDQNCSSCHEWTQEALCTQGKTYATASNTRAVSKSHPYGGGFKQSIKNWAEGGCQ